MELLDAGDERRLDRIGGRLIDRPAPSAVGPQRLPIDEWEAADLRYDRGAGWVGPDQTPWTVTIDGLTLELRPTDAGQVGLFPEQAGSGPGCATPLAGRAEPSVLNLFAHTGGDDPRARRGRRAGHACRRIAAGRRLGRAATRSCRGSPTGRSAGSSTTRSTSSRARPGAGAATTAIVLDPPSYGHGPRGRRWQLDDALPDLLDACAAVADRRRRSCSSRRTRPGLEADDLGDALVDAFDPAPGAATIAIDWTRAQPTAAAGRGLPRSASWPRMIARMIRAADHQPARTRGCKAAVAPARPARARDDAA